MVLKTSPPTFTNCTSTFNEQLNGTPLGCSTRLCTSLSSHIVHRRHARFCATLVVMRPERCMCQAPPMSGAAGTPSLTGSTFSARGLRVPSRWLSSPGRCKITSPCANCAQWCPIESTYIDIFSSCVALPTLPLRVWSSTTWMRLSGADNAMTAKHDTKEYKPNVLS